MEAHASVTRRKTRVGRNGIRTGQLTDRQQAAVRLAAGIGDDIRKTCPEVAEEYRNGLTASESVARHGFDRRYGVSQPAAITAVRTAIRGYSGRCYESYPGLIADKSEGENLAFAHNRRTGIEVYERRLGIQGLTREQKADLRGETDEASAVTDLLFSLHAMIVADSIALAALRTASPASFGNR